MTKIILKIIVKVLIITYISTMERLTRQGDAGGRLAVVIEDDGDVVLAITPPSKHQGHLEFCTGMGGGRSPKVLRALRALAQAIKEENESGRWPDLT
jgi:hypothetical protein